MDAECQKALGRNLRQMIPYDCKTGSYQTWERNWKNVECFPEELGNTNPVAL
mgnify:CR=1 FL=1